MASKKKSDDELFAIVEDRYKYLSRKNLSTIRKEFVEACEELIARQVPKSTIARRLGVSYQSLGDTFKAHYKNEENKK